MESEIKFFDFEHSWGTGTRKKPALTNFDLDDVCGCRTTCRGSQFNSVPLAPKIPLEISTFIDVCGCLTTCRGSQFKHVGSPLAPKIPFEISTLVMSVDVAPRVRGHNSML
jgi:hypothetical protein